MQLAYDVLNVANDGGAWVAIVVIGGIAVQVRREVRALKRAMGVRNDASVATVQVRLMNEIRAHGRIG